MFSAKRFYGVSILLCMALAGCMPANFTRSVRLEQQECDVQVCTELNTGLARCDCKSTEQVERQLREASWLPLE
ncbi:MAG: hypothetical protein SXG53_16250 [Pseudomonadota bacterium]|nr:hypothetical protein [Pseudomonadota bacterium]